MVSPQAQMNNNTEFNTIDLFMAEMMVKFV